MEALERAFGTADAAYMNAKQALTASAADALLATAGGGLPGMLQRQDMGRAAQQLRAYRGWSFVAIRCIASRLAAQPVKLYRRKRRLARGTKQAQPSDLEPIDQHPLLDLLSDPNPLGTQWTFAVSTVANLLLSGKAFWWLTPDEQEDKPALYWLPSSWVEGFAASDRITAWSVRPPGIAEAFAIPAQDMTYFCSPDPADPFGAVSPLVASADAVEADQYITSSQRTMFARGMFPSMALIVGRSANPDGSVSNGPRPQLSGAQRTQLIRAVRHAWSQTINPGDPLVLDGLIEDVKKLSNSPEEMNWIESGKALRERILMSYAVNGIVAGQVESANRASSTEAERHFVNNAVNPLAVAMSQAMTEFLAYRFAAEGEKLVLQIEPCVVKDDELDIRRMQIMAQFGAVELNELRQWGGLPPVDYGDAPVSPSGGVAENIAGIVDSQLAAIGAEQTFKRNGHANAHATH